MSDLYLNFQAPINEPSINNLHTLLTVAMQRPMPPNITILLNSLGGAVHVGVASYNFIRSLPVQITTVSGGNIDSIANIVFLAGKKRYASPESTFHLHSSSRVFQGPQAISAVEEALSSLRSDNDRMAEIVARETNFSRDEMDKFFLQGRTLTASEALEHGFIHGIRFPQMPFGAEIQQVSAVY